MRKLIVLLAALVFALPAARAEERAAFSQAELEQMLAPVALYPDSLLSQVLMAATYPLEVVQAARWSRAHPGLPGDEAVRAAADRDWDPSVKSLLAFPQLLARMDEKLDWTRQLGEAFLAQEGEVMDAVQRLRQSAKAGGHLQTDERVRVVEDGSTVVIEYADPRVVYVPYYDPWVVYGGWWWPAYPPVVWAPWPGYAVVRPGFWWGVGVGVTTGFFYASVNWPYRHVHVVHSPGQFYKPRSYTQAYKPVQLGKWQHDPAHRRNVGYRHREAQKRFGYVPRPPAAGHVPSRPQVSAPAPRNDRPGSAMPPARRASAPQRDAGSQPQRRPPAAVPYDRGHGRDARPVDRADRVGRVRPDAAQYRPAQPYGFARDAGRHAGAVPVRPAFRAGMAGDRPRMAR
ncbi:MAG: DUF3300 domain-containing protein [Betaproteobacteria bacterium]|nr:DUF3300 domain-containing protein [Betaproteobacteria bacterium]MDH5221767.1 DUF3300 domain-containing protein [Betaproteobacteria bacterium]MDH5350062.1 DUF3300 domain-containing protein [Betaproteobacteria bacterium]